MTNSIRCLPCLAVALFAGCTGQAPEERAPRSIEQPPAAIPAEPDLPAGSTVTLDRPQFPDDVFFDDPLSIAANRTRIPDAANATENEAAAEMPADTGVTRTETAAAAAVDWAAMLPADVLVAEVNRIRERFEPKLGSVATFNSSLLDFPPYSAELAALAGIATEHSGDIAWKNDAKHIRDLAGAMNSDQLQRGQKSYEQVHTPFAKVAALLDGQRPDDLPEADDATDFAMVADFGYLMRRFESGQNAMQTIGSSEQAFQANAADLAREARVIAALSKVFALDDYGYGDDDMFQGFAAAMTSAASDAATAAESGDFAKFDLSLNALGQSCVQCHGEYRNN